MWKGKKHTNLWVFGRLLNAEAAFHMHAHLTQLDLLGNKPKEKVTFLLLPAFLFWKKFRWHSWQKLVCTNGAWTRSEENCYKTPAHAQLRQSSNVCAISKHHCAGILEWGVNKKKCIFNLKGYCKHHRLGLRLWLLKNVLYLAKVQINLISAQEPGIL